MAHKETYTGDVLPLAPVDVDVATVAVPYSFSLLLGTDRTLLFLLYCSLVLLLYCYNV